MTTVRTNWRRRLGGVVVAIIVATTVTAAAASLGGVSAAGLGAGQASVISCDADGVSASYAVSSGAVQSITVSGISANCVNGSLRVVLADGTGANIASGGPTTVTGTS